MARKKVNPKQNSSIEKKDQPTGKIESFSMVRKTTATAKINSFSMVKKTKAAVPARRARAKKVDRIVATVKEVEVKKKETGKHGLEGKLDINWAFAKPKPGNFKRDSGNKRFVKDMKAIKTHMKSDYDKFPAPPISSSDEHMIHDGRGLFNYGLFTCFRISLFQALFRLPKFVNWLWDHHKPDNCMAEAGSLYCLTCKIRKLSFLYWKHPEKPVDKLLVDITKLCRFYGFNPRSENGYADPDEFFEWMIGHMEMETPAHIFSLLKATYQLVLTRGIKCSDEACGYVSETQQIEANFSLYCQRPAPIKGVKPQLTGLLEDYAYEELEYTCEKCKHHGNSSREARIAEAPDYLIIHFKRALDGGGKDKTKIEYGHELNLTKYRYKPEMGTLRYDLKAVVSHQGGQAGHYEAMAFNRRDPETGQAVWKEYNDERVIPMHPTRALDPLGGLTPYLLFYARRSEPTPQSKADLRK